MSLTSYFIIKSIDNILKDVETKEDYTFTIKKS